MKVKGLGLRNIVHWKKILVSKRKEKRVRVKQLQLLKSYSGYRDCGNSEVDAYNLYEKNQLICQPCLVRKTGGSSSLISLTEQQKWYKKRWGVD